MKTTEWKDTEIGRIPKDWEVKPLGEVMSFKNGLNSDAQSYGDGYPLISVLDALSDNVITSKTIKSRVKTSVSEFNAFSVKRGDLIFVRSSETLEDVGRSNVYLDDTPAVFGGFVIRGRLKENIDPLYLRYLLSERGHRLRICSFGAGAQHYNISQEGLEKVLLVVSINKTEQQRIAKALSDIDMLITSLDKAIEKKRLVKLGAMQQLLTGKKRLKGFTGEWEKGCFGDFFPVERGTILKSSDYRFGRIPVIAGGTTPAGFHDTANRTGYTITISASGANAGYVSFHKEDIFASDCSTISASPNYSIVFVYYLLCSMQNEIYRSQTGGAQPHIHPKDIAPLRVSIPMDIVEQQEIANVLSMIDGEISSLTHEREKYLRLKDGMMQELLTGKTRLI